MIPEVTFVHPRLVHLLWGAALVVAALAWLELRRSESLARFVSRVMQARLAERPSRGRQIGRLSLVALVLLFGVLALMRPQTPGGTETIEADRAAADVLVVMDVSKSMLAEDAAPSRLERAKADVLEMVEQLRGHRVGLIGFAGRAALLCPLTPDRSYFRMVMKSVTTSSIGRGGTRIGDGLRLAVKTLAPETGAKLVLLITDGEDQDSSPEEAAKLAREAGVHIVAVGFGDEAGSEILLTDPATGARRALTDRDGNVVRSRLDGATLRRLALATDGAYVPAGTGALDLEAIVRDHVQPMTRDTSTSALRHVPADHYPSCVLAALLALLASVWVGALPRRASS